VYAIAAAVDESAAVLPAQITVGEADTFTGSGATEMVVTAVEVPHPLPPVTVSTFVTLGLKETPFVTPFVQV
jgi:hypothetical protein